MEAALIRAANLSCGLRYDFTASSIPCFSSIRLDLRAAGSLEVAAMASLFAIVVLMLCSILAVAGSVRYPFSSSLNRAEESKRTLSRIKMMV